MSQLVLIVVLSCYAVLLADRSPFFLGYHTQPRGRPPEIMHRSIQREAPIAPRTLYNYQLSITPTRGAKPVTTTCATTALHKNDQLLAAFQFPKNEKISTQQSIDEVAYDRVPDVYRFGPIQVTTFNTQAISVRTLKK